MSFVTQYTKEIQEMILREVDIAIRNNFHQNPDEMPHGAIVTAVFERNRIAVMYSLPPSTMEELT